MENILQSLPQITIYLDDVLITGKTNKKRLENLVIALKRLDANIAALVGAVPRVPTRTIVTISSSPTFVGMARSGLVMYKVWVGEVVLNKHVGHTKAATSQSGREQNLSGPSEHLARLSEPLVSPRPPSVEETSSDDAMDMADVLALMSLPPTEDKFRPRCSGRKRLSKVQYMLP
eukprot:g45872.t1